MSTEERLNDLRTRVLAGEEVTTSEYAEIIQALRSKRNGDITAAAERKTARTAQPKEAKPVRSLSEILAGVKNAKS